MQRSRLAPDTPRQSSEVQLLILLSLLAHLKTLVQGPDRYGST
jgi:hypothetical protein